MRWTEQGTERVISQDAPLPSEEETLCFWPPLTQHSPAELSSGEAEAQPKI